MPHTHPSRVGNAFILTADLGLYVGPDTDGKGPILAIFRTGETDYDRVATFRNATGATRVSRLLQDHIDMVLEQTAEQRPHSRIPVRGDAGQVVGYADVFLTSEEAIEALHANGINNWSIDNEDVPTEEP